MSADFARHEALAKTLISVPITLGDPTCFGADHPLASKPLLHEEVREVLRPGAQAVAGGRHGPHRGGAALPRLDARLRRRGLAAALRGSRQRLARPDAQDGAGERRALASLAAPERPPEGSPGAHAAELQRGLSHASSACLLAVGALVVVVVVVVVVFVVGITACSNLCVFKFFGICIKTKSAPRLHAVLVY